VGKEGSGDGRQSGKVAEAEPRGCVATQLVQRPHDGAQALGVDDHPQAFRVDSNAQALGVDGHAQALAIDRRP